MMSRNVCAHKNDENDFLSTRCFTILLVFPSPKTIAEFKFMLIYDPLNLIKEKPESEIVYLQNCALRATEREKSSYAEEFITTKST
jgi:hypothetical protein